MRIVQKEVLRKFREIAQKHNVPVQTVIDVESSIWKMVKEKISEGDRNNPESFHNIYLRFLGTFKFHRSMYDYMNKFKTKDNGE